MISNRVLWRLSRGRMTRRELLLRAGGACGVALATGFPARWAEAAETVSPAMARLSGYMSEARDRALPEDVVEKAKEHILDTIAAMISGSQLVPGHAAIEFARAYGGEKISTVVGSQVLCGPIEAALANGVLAHSDETDDSHAPSQSHPGCAAVPAALAVGEKFSISGSQFLRAVVLGYDLGPRVTMTLGAVDLQSKGHKSTHSIAGVFSAAASAGCAANLNAQQMRWLLDYAAQQCSGILAWQRDTEHMEKSFVFAGMPTRSGVTAALLVQAGWTGVADIFSGPDNFLLAYVPQADPAGLVDKLGERYEVARTNIKKWTVGSPIQAPLDAMENLRKRHPFDAVQVKEVVVRLATVEAKTVNDREMPDISLQYMMAVMLVDKTASFQAAHDKARMQNAEILQQRAKVRLVPDEELQQRLPSREAIVEVTLTDGTRLTERVEAVRGTAENPMTRDEVVAKARDLMAPVVGDAVCGKLIEKVFGIESVADVREFRPLLTAERR
jgi:2-methylcitrate dehydratase PrpD